MRRGLNWVIGVGLMALLSQASCSTGEHDAVAAELDVSRETCALGAITTVQRCGGETASCHVCGRPHGREDGDDAVCLQPCTVGKDECPGSQRCVPIDGLRVAGGYARIGDCPAGYCE